MDNPLILKLLQKLHHLCCAHKTVHFCWIPSHIGIRGNEAADVAAKESLSQDIIASQVPYTDLKPHINSFIANKWQERWSSCPDNKLFKIKPTLGVWPPGFRNSRKEEVVLSRLRIGHTYFSHSYILRGLPISPTAHWSYNPLVLRPIGPTAHWSYDPLVLQPIGPTTN